MEATLWVKNEKPALVPAPSVRLVAPEPAKVET